MKSIEKLLQEYAAIEHDIPTAHAITAPEVLQIARTARAEANQDPNRMLYTAIMQALDVGFMHGMQYGRYTERKKAKKC